MGFDGDDTYAPRRPKLFSSFGKDREGSAEVLGSFLNFLPPASVSGVALCAQAVVNSHQICEVARWL